jgi:hypothetical protein
LAEARVRCVALPAAGRLGGVVSRSYSPPDPGFTLRQWFTALLLERTVRSENVPIASWSNPITVTFDCLVVRTNP